MMSVTRQPGADYYPEVAHRPGSAARLGIEDRSLRGVVFFLLGLRVFPVATARDTGSLRVRASVAGKSLYREGRLRFVTC
jgi:hypothetical protein